MSEPPVEKKSGESSYWEKEHLQFVSNPDRYGSVGELRAEIDDRPRIIRHRFAFMPLEKRVEYFDDDHARSLNGQLVQGGGRDLRTFSLTTPEREARLRALEQERDQLVDRLNAQLLAVPYKVEARHERKGRSEKWTDDVKGRRSAFVTHHRLVWSVGDRVIHHEELDTSEEGDAGTWTLDQQQVEEAWRRGNEAATEALRGILKGIETKEADSEAMKEKARLQAVLDEIAVYEGELEVDLPVYLAPKDVSAARRSQLIAQQEELWDAYAPKYKPEFKRNPLYLVGLNKALHEYRERGADPLGAGPIDFQGLWERSAPYQETPLSDEEHARRSRVMEELNREALRRMNEVRFWPSPNGDAGEPESPKEERGVEQKEREPVTHEEALRLQRDVGRAGLFVDAAQILWESSKDKGTQRRGPNWRKRADGFAQALKPSEAADAAALRVRAEKLTEDARNMAMDAARQHRKEFREDWPSLVSEGIGRVGALETELDLALTAQQRSQIKDRVVRFVIEHASAPDQETVFEWMTDVTD